jgi:hypothetical protein
MTQQPGKEEFPNVATEDITLLVNSVTAHFTDLPGLFISIKGGLFYGSSMN